MTVSVLSASERTLECGTAAAKVVLKSAGPFERVRGTRRGRPCDHHRTSSRITMLRTRLLLVRKVEHEAASAGS
jgi:hypothetical protein